MFRGYSLAGADVWNMLLVASLNPQLQSGGHTRGFLPWLETGCSVSELAQGMDCGQGRGGRGTLGEESGAGSVGWLDLIPSFKKVPAPFPSLDIWSRGELTGND